ncbi:uncharacterized protein LOC131682077 [Topomyia yanbarensis]|uniref:uncharacterized protein LOC131682077 n=1 Tax=Topomyia yanbarensis TaxID=2498891 RepID=UPI00273BDF2D|nr:uncharacterized protein LOC131682077 [Topomyia yanbarensis]
MIGGEWTDKMATNDNQETSNCYTALKTNDTSVVEHTRHKFNQNTLFQNGFINGEQLCNRSQEEIAIQTSNSLDLSGYTSTVSYRSTPSPDFILSSSQTSSPLFAGFRQLAPIPQTTTVSTNYLQPNMDMTMAMNTYADHDYTQSSSPTSVTTLSCRSTSPSLEAERVTTAGRAPSDSGNSTMPDEINPLCMNDWYRDLLKTEFSTRLKDEMSLIVQRSFIRKKQFVAVRTTELPSDLEYNPNKSRLRKTYENPSEAADRERNNLASRRSRFKKKISQQLTNIYLEFDRNENAQLYAMQNWIGRIVFELESKWLDNGATPEELYELRHHCGFPQNQPENGHVSELF